MEAPHSITTGLRSGRWLCPSKTLNRWPFVQLVFFNGCLMHTLINCCQSCMQIYWRHPEVLWDFLMHLLLGWIWWNGLAWPYCQWSETFSIHFAYNGFQSLFRCISFNSPSLRLKLFFYFRYNDTMYFNTYDQTRAVYWGLHKVWPGLPGLCNKTNPIANQRKMSRSRSSI